MKTGKKIGVWMDHSNAHLIELTEEPMKTKNIISQFTHEEKEQSAAKSENLMHNKEQHLQGEYYKNVSAAIKDYDSVLLFGPTTAKDELSNLLKEDAHFHKIQIAVLPADKMTENQQHAFVKNHFSKDCLDFISL